MSRKILRRPAVLDRTGLSRSSLYRLIQSGEFAAPVRLGKRAVGWDSEAVQAWVDERIESLPALRRPSRVSHTPESQPNQ